MLTGMAGANGQAAKLTAGTFLYLVITDGAFYFHLILQNSFSETLTLICTKNGV